MTFALSIGNLKYPLPCSRNEKFIVLRNHENIIGRSYIKENFIDKYKKKVNKVVESQKDKENIEHRNCNQ